MLIKKGNEIQFNADLRKINKPNEYKLKRPLKTQKYLGEKSITKITNK